MSCPQQLRKARRSSGDCAEVVQRLRGLKLLRSFSGDACEESTPELLKKLASEGDLVVSICSSTGAYAGRSLRSTLGPKFPAIGHILRKVFEIPNALRVKKDPQFPRSLKGLKHSLLYTDV
ncbi:hypothetical protein CROQUDRAFT_101934 [Cronartium quercuum f. sp. fusiforme G11]|uniref:Uncharacterized protein n=1 Tax=Cronartium quercuum f. sp. fusiforme G11 TaxID=708437 RepID=A0A9P6N8I7_9BASI|nr:hypothetical protein CROQUDRAFT_101934 [Cronartium quercuum f. sp. fusiforme G11]